MAKRTRVLLLIPHLGGGGAERVTSLLACGLDPARFDVHLGLVTQESAEGHWLPAWVTVHRIDAPRVRYSAWGLFWLIRRLRPDVILSGMAHLNMLVLLLRPLFPRRTRVIIRQNAAMVGNGNDGTSRFWYSLLYPLADAVVCQTPAMSEELAGLAQACGKVCVLPNPVDVHGIRVEVRNAAENRWKGPGPHLLAVGRLAPEKGFDLLLAAFAMLRRSYPHADLTILGDGRERPLLESLAWVLGLGSSLRIAGYVEHPPTWYPGTTLFVLSSRSDALPNALLEAAAGGLPIVTTRASSGLVALVEGQTGVWLAPDISAQGIHSALVTALHRIEPDKRYAHYWLEPFRKERAVAAYEALITGEFMRESS